MASALIGGLLQQGYSAAQIHVVEINAEVRDKIYRKFSVEVMAELSDRRAMPNTPALIRAAVTGLFALPEVNTNEKQDAETILSAVGSVLWFEREELLDVVTAMSGSGPAYVFYFIEAMQQAGRELGLDETQARQLSLETFLGAAKLASQSNENVTTLRDNVTSKNGTTEHAIQTMENDGINRKIIRAIHASNERARELGNEFGSK